MTLRKNGGIPPIVYLLGILLLGGFGWWATNTVTNPLVNTGASGNKIQLLGDTFSGYAIFRDPEFVKTLKDEGVDLVYADEFDQVKRAAALNSGAADVLVTTADQYLKQKPQGKIVALIDRTVGADAVVFDSVKYPYLTSLVQLPKFLKEFKATDSKPGLTFAGDTPSEFLALVLDTKFDEFNLTDFRLDPVGDSSEAWRKLQNKEVPVAVLWEPYVTQAQKAGYTVVLSSQDLPRSILDVMVVSDQALQSKSKKIQALVTAYYQRLDNSLGDKTRLLELIAVDGKLAPSDAQAVLKGIDFFGSIEADAWVKTGLLDQRLKSIQAILILAGKTSAKPITGMVEPRYIAQAAQITRDLVATIELDNPEIARKLLGQDKAMFTPTINQVNKGQAIGNLTVRGEVKFTSGSSILTPDGKKTLDMLVQEIDDFDPQAIKVEVVGHTSRTGSQLLNQKLSQSRAQVVVQYFKNKQLKHGFAAQGRGFSQPLPGIAPTDSRNQRTEIRLKRV